MSNQREYNLFTLEGWKASITGLGWLVRCIFHDTFVMQYQIGQCKKHGHDWLKITDELYECSCCGEDKRIVMTEFKGIEHYINLARVR